MTLNTKTSGELLKYVGKLEEENRKLKLHIEAKDKAYIALLKDYEEIKEDNKNLKESLNIATKCSSKEEDGIIRLSEENRKLKEELERYKKQYEHSMGEDYIDEDLYDLDC